MLVQADINSFAVGRFRRAP